MRRSVFVALLLVLGSSGCENTQKVQLFSQNGKEAVKSVFPFHSELDVENRSLIVKNMESKIEHKAPLIVHCFVPLCDNEYQGIVPTSESLGNGFSLTSNLYWATSNGMKKYFMIDRRWYYLNGLPFNTSDTVLERAVFERSIGHAKVVLICDAYRGDMMKPCLEDYFNCLAGNSKDSIPYHKSFLEINNNADMVVFNGHNGLMDTAIDSIVINRDKRFFESKDAVSIACSSHNYFSKYFMETGAYPLVTTFASLYPGAFVLNGIIEKWAVFSSDQEIAEEAGDAYHEIKKCGKQAARNMFGTGW
jgi:hypothetical protein